MSVTWPDDVHTQDRFVVLEVQATGPDPQSHGVIEVAAVRFAGGQPVETWARLCDPGIPLPLRTHRLTGLTHWDLQGKPHFSEVAGDLVTTWGDDPVVCYDSGFVRRFLEPYWNQEAWGELQSRMVDVMELAQLVYPREVDYRLESMLRREGMAHQGPRRAAEDARRVGLLYLRLLGRLQELPAGFLRECLDIMGEDSWGLAEAVAGALAAGGKAVEGEWPPQPRHLSLQGETLDSEEETEEVQPLDVDLVVACFQPGGCLAGVLPGFEERRQQVEMARAVAEAFNRERVLMVEAGTGTGKSLAYLIPAGMWALQNRCRVVISTHTLNLQQQLFEKDAPLAAAALGRFPAIAVLKGRANYLCFRRWRDAVASPPADPRERRFLLRLSSWVRCTDTGDRSELNLPGWQQIWWWNYCADEDCWGQRCPWGKYCFLQAARRRAHRAPLVLINHSLLATALRGGAVLPDYRYLIIDEAHHLDQVATEHLGHQLDFARARSWLRSLLRRPGAGPPGLLWRTRTSNETVTEVASGLVRVLEAMVSVESQLRALLRRRGRDVNAMRIERLEVSTVRTQARQLAEMLASCARALEELAAAETEDSAGSTFQAGAQRLREWHTALVQGILEQDPDHVRWLESTGGDHDGRLVLKTAPLWVDELLREGLFARLECAILTSATMTVAGSFQYVARRLGLFDDPRVDQLLLSSPFDFQHQALLAVPTDLPGPDAGEDRYLDAVCDFLHRLIPTVGGRTLVLFTSHRMLREVYRRLKSPMEDQGIDILGQRLDGERSWLLDQLRRDQRVAVLGTSAFWEGIDVPGPALSCVVLVRLPFWPPDLPLLEARSAALQRMGQDPFRALALPEAVIRFRQGFGRLVRTAQDRGVVVVLDSRLLPGRRSYGRFFVASLPRPSGLAGSSEQVLEAVAEWLTRT